MSGVVMPAGAIVTTAQSDTGSPPAGWLFCDGSSQVRATYPALFAVIGSTYGSVDGTHFTLPDLRGRAVVTLDNAGGSDAGRLSSANTLGTGGGAESTTLTASQIPAHTHTLANHVHGGGTNNVFSAVIDAQAGTNYGILSRGNTDGSGPLTTDNGTVGGAAHSNMPPFITLNSIIKT